MNSYAPANYPLFNELPQALRVLYTMVLIILGLGYAFAMIQIYEVHAGRDGRAGLSVEDVRIAYSGSPADTRLEAALKGPMSRMLPEAEKAKIYQWIHDGAKKDAFDAQIAPITSSRCILCHSSANPHLPSLETFEAVRALAERDTGVSIGTLVRVSHIHLFGLTFIFAFLGLIFSHSYVRRSYMKSVIIAIPFVAIILDIASWWLTKVSTPFAYVVVVGGGLMGVSFLYQWVVSMYQLWFFKCPPEEFCVP